MKANIKKKDPEKLYIGEVELDFNCGNENDIKRMRDAGQEIEKKYPNAMDLSVTENGTPIDALPATEEGVDDILKNYEVFTAATCMFFTLLFGKEKTKELLGDSPYYKKCKMVLVKFNLLAIKQAEQISTEISKEESEIAKLAQKYAPVGAKGAPKE